MKLDSTQCFYSPDIGVIPEGESVFCGVCGDKMTEYRNVYGPRGFAMAMSGSKQLHDLFMCENEKKTWHRQVLFLFKEAKETPSASLEKMFLEEADGILKTRQATKGIYN